eukprot:2101463-Prymnesium_polylepis.1
MRPGDDSSAWIWCAATGGAESSVIPRTGRFRSFFDFWPPNTLFRTFGQLPTCYMFLNLLRKSFVDGISSSTGREKQSMSSRRTAHDRQVLNVAPVPARESRISTAGGVKSNSQSW